MFSFSICSHQIGLRDKKKKKNTLKLLIIKLQWWTDQRIWKFKFPFDVDFLFQWLCIFFTNGTMSFFASSAVKCWRGCSIDPYIIFHSSTLSAEFIYLQLIFMGGTFVDKLWVNFYFYSLFFSIIF